MAVPIHLAIGGLTFELTPTDPRVTCRIAGAMRRFFSPAAAADVQLTVRTFADEEAADGTLLFDSGAVWRLFEQAGGFRIECTSPAFGSKPYKVASFDQSFTRGDIAIREGTFDGEVDPLEYPLDEVLVSNLLARGRGIEFHSCGLIDDRGRGHLFVGVSGAGKTTTARLWERHSVIVSDDRVIVRRIGDEYRIYGTPWHGEAELSSPESAPLQGIYLLAQAPETELRNVDPAEAVARLFTCAFPLFHDSTALGFTLGLLDDLVRTVPVRELRFTPDESAVAAVKNATA